MTWQIRRPFVQATNLVYRMKGCSTKTSHIPHSLLAAEDTVATILYGCKINADNKKCMLHSLLLQSACLVSLLVSNAIECSVQEGTSVQAVERDSEIGHICWKYNCQDPLGKMMSLQLACRPLAAQIRLMLFLLSALHGVLKWSPLFGASCIKYSRIVCFASFC